MLVESETVTGVVAIQENIDIVRRRIDIDLSQIWHEDVHDENTHGETHEKYANIYIT